MSHPFRQIQTRRLPPFPGNARGPRSSPCGEVHFENEELSPEIVKTFLSSHEEVLQEYILDHVSIESLEELLYKKRQLLNKATSSENIMLSNRPSQQDRYKGLDIAVLQRSILNDAKDKPDFLPMLYEMTNVVACGIKAETCSLYAYRSGTKELCLYIPKEDAESGDYTVKAYGTVGPGTTVAAYVGSENKAILLKDLLGDERFPRGIGLEGCLMFSVICVPVTLPTSDLLGVVEFVRTNKSPAFCDSDLQSVVSAIAWAGVTMYQCQINKALNNQAEINEFLLEVSRVIFDDIVQMDALIEKIMIYTKNLVHADRCALFLVDQERQELFSNLLDQGREKDGKPVFSKGEEIRFPLSKGIAGQVARTSEILNIKDPYSHPQFNRDVDKQTGYITKSILCMPIISKGLVIGVVQMINKKAEGGFTGADETSFKMFSVYCAIALHYSKIYRKMQMRTTQYKVAMEHLSYHVKCTEQEYQQLLQLPFLEKEDVPKDLSNFFFVYDLKVTEENPLYLCQLYMQMMRNLFGKGSFDVSKMCNFVMTVKKNYRPVPYHNWYHGWNVAHGMYTMLRKLRHEQAISSLRKKALMIAALCHDVDHRGYNNTFLQKFNEPLAELYEKSTMEQHHYNLTVTIMQQEGNEIFAGKMTGEEYKELLQYINHAILATDLMNYINEGKPLAKECQSPLFSLEKQQNLDLTLAVMMTGADLLVMCKDWNTQKEATEQLYAEFHIQGDKEKEHGAEPMNMMDRDKIDELPKNQVGFMRYICVPCYETLAFIFPDLSPLLAACMDNIEQWQRVLEGKNTNLWEPLKSLPKPLRNKVKSEAYKNDDADQDST